MSGLTQFCCVSVLLGAACGGLTSPESIPDGDILYLLISGPGVGLYVYDIEGDKSGKIEVRAPVGSGIQWARWSPGRDFVLLTSDLGYKDKAPDLYLLGNVGGDPCMLTGPVGHSDFTWSPGGDRIAYTRGLPVWGYTGPGDVVVRNMDNTTEKNLTDTPERSEHVVDWFPDGERLLISIDTPISEVDSLFVYDIESGDYRLIWVDDSFLSPRVSQQDGMIAYLDGFTMVVLQEAAEGEYKNLPISEELIGLCVGPVWSPDGKLLYARKNSDGCGMYCMDPASGETVRLLEYEGEAISIKPLEWR